DGAVGQIVVVHASNPLVTMLKRFNAYSNNDIERLGATLGPPEDLERFLAARSADPPEAVSLETLSGLGSNRMTPIRVVRLVRDFGATCERLGLTPADLLPVSGCDPGTLESYPKLEAAEMKGAFVGKTGTLT